ncbi:MAG: DUF7738 domain-containing protein [Flavobacteriaceae bacterium]|nr:hypothetical protein [Psychroflexus sp.]
MGIFDFRNPDKRKKKTTTLECDPHKIRINKTVIQFPTTYAVLKDILGEASRIEPLNQTENNVYLWDDLGIYCSTPDPENVLMLMLIKDNGYDLGNQPKKNFTGNVFVDDKAIDNNLPYIAPDRPYIMRAIEKDNKLVAIAVGWNSKL